MKINLTKTIKLLTIPVAAMLVLAGCTATGKSQSSDKLQIVTSINVWGDVAAAVGGDLVEVTSLIGGVNMDPHSYEASVRDQLDIEKADLVIANGGGYDDFIEKMAAKAGKTVFKATDNVSSINPKKNEHVWYSIASVSEVAALLGKKFSELDLKNAETYVANVKNYIQRFVELLTRYTADVEAKEGRTVFATEPLADWLLADLSFVNKTPEEFAEAVENETDIPPATMKESLDLIKSGKIEMLVLNVQTESAQTQKIVDAAKAAGVKIVSFTETLPAGIDYLEWMAVNLDNLLK